MRLITELRRRNVFRVAIGYVVVAWLVLQVADVMIDNIGAPDWLFGAILLMLALGLPLALVFAWAFELTPEGIKREHEVDRSRSMTRTTGRKLDRAIIVVLALALAWFAWDKFSPAPGSGSSSIAGSTPGSDAPPQKGSEPNAESGTPDPSTPDQSIAVLPFVNMSADADNEYFSDGLSEELLNLLARVEGLKVASRTSSFKFRDSQADIGEIGDQLKVTTVLEGSVRKSGDQLRITAQLIKVDDGFHLWSQTYDRQLDNIFAVQDEIATAIVEALRLPLLGEEQAPLAVAAQPASFEAYDLFLLGKHHARAFTEEGFEKSIDYLAQAVALDPEYAPAWSQLAHAYVLVADYGGRDMNAMLPEAERAVERALALDPDSADALVTKSTIRGYQGRGAERVQLLERAIALDPEHAQGLRRLATAIIDTAPQRTLMLAERAYALDPLFDMSRSTLVMATFAARGYEAARERFASQVAQDPDNPAVYEVWANVERASGHLDRAVTYYEKLWALRPGDAWAGFQIVLCYTLLGDEDRAERWVTLTRERAPDTMWADFAPQTLAFYRGEYESLLSELMAARDTPRGDNPFYLEFLGDVLVQMDRKEEARAAFQQALERLNPDPNALPTGDEASILLSMAHLEQPGPERDRVLERIRQREALLKEIQPNRWQGDFVEACLAALGGDRTALFAALDHSIDKGFRGGEWLEQSYLFREWRDDPLFREAVGRLKRISAEQLARLDTSEDDAT